MSPIERALRMRDHNTLLHAVEEPARRRIGLRLAQKTDLKSHGAGRKLITSPTPLRRTIISYHAIPMPLMAIILGMLK
jgi:hypothetical protein